ncbi:MAG: hypothetical protein KI790_08125 [Cyclobacteriaceae bacterium]|nr:hypothetical protein [Cyclobacteriaceae bacterium HetDA_MAG_MS6]
MTTFKTASEILKEHFEQLQKAVPEAYNPTEKVETQEDKLFTLIKRTLFIVEAVYFQSKDMFPPTRMEEYMSIISELKELGFDYHGNEELVEKAAAAAIMSAKLPMEKAKGDKGKKEQNTSSKRAV